MTNPLNPADDHKSIYLDAMSEHLTKYEGEIVTETIVAVFAADRFGWRDDATRAAIARNLRDIPPDTDTPDAITRVICAVYDERGFPHDPGAVRQAVGRHLQELGQTDD